MPQKYVIFQKKAKKLSGYLKKKILFNQSTALNFNTPCHIFFIETVIEAGKNEKVYFLGILSYYFF